MKVSEKFYVGFRQVNPNLKIKNSEILSMFVDVAGIHAEECGNKIRETDIRWLLTGYKLKFFKRPEFDDKLEILTWATEVRGVRSSREFEVRNENGELMLVGLSSWVSTNYKTRQLERLSEEKIKTYGSEPDYSNFKGESISRIEDEENFIKEQEVLIDWRFTDLMGHLNNTYYVDIAEHIMDENLRDKVQNMDFEVVYKKEIREGEKVRCFLTETENYVKVLFKSEDLSVMHAMVKYLKV